MDACNTSATLDPSPFEALQKDMASDLYWVRFFARPCCPAPNAQDAAKMLDRLKAEVESREDFTAQEKSALVEIIEERKAWYPTSGLCKH